MRSVDINEAKTNLSHLVELAAAGEPFIIAKSGQPLVKVVPLDAQTIGKQRLGFQAGDEEIPEDFEQMGAAEIERLFEGRG